MSKRKKLNSKNPKYWDKKSDARKTNKRKKINV